MFFCPLIRTPVNLNYTVSCKTELALQQSNGKPEH